MTNEEYLALFNNMNEDNTNNYGMLNETPKHNNYQPLNETPNTSSYRIEENLNGGWNTDEIQIESRINGIKQKQNPQNFNNQHKRHSRHELDLNGLNQFIDDDDLNEVYQTKKKLDIPNVNEHIKDYDIVPVELFERMNTNAMLTLNQKMFK